VSRPRFAPLRAPLLAAAAGLALALALPGPGWAPLALLFPGLLLESLHRAERARTAIALGQLAGTVHWAVATSWVVSVMHVFGGLPLPLAVVSLLVMAGLLGLTWAATATVAWLARPALRVWLLPLAWTAFEAFRQWPPYQFPWNPTAACLAAWPAALGSLPVWGASGLGWALTACGAGLWGLLRGETRRSGAASLGTVALLLALATALSPPPRPVGEPVAVAVLQPGTTLEEKWDPEQWDQIYARVFRLAADAAAAGAELELWPESAVPSRLDLDPGLESALTALTGRLGVEAVVNSIGATDDGGYTNAAYLVSGAGVSPERYDKVRLVPFGEYVPLLGRFAFTRSLVREVPSFTPGDEVRLLPARVPLGVAICYEITFADLVAKQARLGAGLLGTVTNDGWYGFSSAPAQHFAQAVLRAAESRRWLARAALTGISGFVDPTGRVTQRLDVGRPGFLLERVQPMAGLTPRSRWGDWWGVVCAVVSLVALGRLGAGRHRR